MRALSSRTVEGFVHCVRTLVERRVLGALPPEIIGIDPKVIMPGKMLRTRLAGSLYAGGWSSVNPATVQAACAATEMVHTASLCHDDVVDNSLIRRSLPTVWRTSSPSGAILIGDLLLCEAMDLLISTENGRYLTSFMGRLTEVVRAEIEQELVWRGCAADAETCLRLARGKTGPLFAFVAGVCGSDDEALCGLLEEAGYRIGTAYQIADDLLDILGTESIVGKTLGTDSVRGKLTLPQLDDDGGRVARENIGDLCTSAVEILRDFPKVQEGLKEFLIHDFGPVLDRGLGVDVGIAV